MGWTKRDLVTQAYECLGYASYIYDAAPEQLDNALRRLDTLVSTLKPKTGDLGYPLPVDPSDSSLNEDANVSDAAYEALYLALAMRIAPSIGKQVSQDLKQSAKAAMDSLLLTVAMPTEMQLNGTVPAGAGNKYILSGNGFLPPTETD